MDLNDSILNDEAKTLLNEVIGDLMTIVHKTTEDSFRMITFECLLKRKTEEQMIMAVAMHTFVMGTFLSSKMRAQTPEFRTQMAPVIKTMMERLQAQVNS